MHRSRKFGGEFMLPHKAFSMHLAFLHDLWQKKIYMRTPLCTQAKMSVGYDAGLVNVSHEVISCCKNDGSF